MENKEGSEDCYRSLQEKEDNAWIASGKPVMFPVSVSNGTETKGITIPWDFDNAQKVGDKVTIINDEGSSVWTIVRL